MKAIVQSIRSFAVEMGGPGLFFIGFLDSSILSLPEINDLLVVLMVTEHPHRMVFYASMSTLGSIAGCLFLYGVAYKGGEALLRKRFSERRVAAAMRVFQRYGFLAIIVPALLPPPAPFKIFVLLAGVARMPTLQFVTAIAIGRGVRYFVEGLLALWYGRRAIDYVQANGATVSIAVAAVVLIGGVLFILWRRRLRRGGTVVK